MEELEEPLTMDWQDYWSLLVRRRRMILVAVFVCWLAGWGASWLLPARYRSETLLLVEPPKVPQEYVASNVANDFQLQIQTMTQRILSRARLLRIIDNFHLDPARSAVPDEQVARMRKDIEIKQEETPGHKQLAAFRISYTAGSPLLAQQVAERLTSLFIAENLAAQRTQSESTTQFLQNEVEAARQAMAAQEAQLGRFKAQHLGELPSQAAGNMQMVAGLQARAERLTAALSHAREQRLYLESLLGQYREVEVVNTAPPEDPQLVRLRSELAEARMRYTDANSYVRRLQAQIDAIEKPRADGVMRTVSGGKTLMSAASMQAATPRMQVQSQIKSNEQEIRDAESQLKETEAQLRQCQSRLNAAPIYEQQLAVLTRDYEQLKDNHESLLKKQMQSQLATNLEISQQDAQLSVLDPPSLPARASWPDRMRFSLGGLAAGLLLGISAALAWEKSGNRIWRERDIRHLMAHHIPENVETIAPLVMVGIPHIAEPGEANAVRRRRRMEWGLVSAVCLAIAAANMISLLRG